MSEEGDFLREFEDEESQDPPQGGNLGNMSGVYNRQHSKMSEAISHKSATSGFYKLDQAIGAVGTPQSTHLDLHKAESQLSAASNNNGRRSANQADLHNNGGAGDEFPMMPMSLADLQDDDDKSSKESGEVSPEAFDAREEMTPAGGHHRQNTSAMGPHGGGRKDGSALGSVDNSNKRVNKRRGRFSRSRSQSPKGFQEGGQGPNQGNFFGGEQQQQPFFQGGGNRRGNYGGQDNVDHHGHHGGNNHFGGGNQGHYGDRGDRGGRGGRGGGHRGDRGGFGGRGGRGGGGYQNNHYNNGGGQFGGGNDSRSQNNNNQGGGSGNFGHQNSFNSQNSGNTQNNSSNFKNNQNSQQTQQSQQQLTALQTQLEQLISGQRLNQQIIQQNQPQMTQLQQQLQVMPQDQNLQSQLKQVTEKVSQSVGLIHQINLQVQMNQHQQQQLTQQIQQSQQNHQNNNRENAGNSNNSGGGHRGGGGYGGNNNGGPGGHQNQNQMQNQHHGGNSHGNHRGGYNDHMGRGDYNGGRGGRGDFNSRGRGRGFNNRGHMGGDRGFGGGRGDRGGHMGNRGFGDRGGHGGHRGRGDHHDMGGRGGRGGHNNHNSSFGGNNHHGNDNHNNRFDNHRGPGGNNHNSYNNNNNNNQFDGGNGSMGGHSQHSMRNNLGLHHQRSDMSMGSQQMGGTPRNNSMSSGKPLQQANVINARRFSVYIKNVPQDKFNIVEIDSFFKVFGEVVRIDRHPEKMAATVKFKDIESAMEAANYALQQHRPIWDNPNVQLIYNVTSQTPRGAPNMPILAKHHSMPAPPSPVKPQLTEAERQKLQQLEDVNKKIEQRCQQLLAKHSAEIQKGLAQLNQSGLTPEQIAQAEQQIEASKTKMRQVTAKVEQLKQTKLQQAQQARQQFKQAKQQHMAQSVAAPKAPAPRCPIEIQLINIAPQMRSFGPILECLKSVAQVSDFKFTDDEKATAYVKFMHHEPSADSLIESMRAKLSSTHGPVLPFEPTTLSTGNKMSDQPSQNPEAGTLQQQH